MSDPQLNCLTCSEAAFQLVRVGSFTLCINLEITHDSIDQILPLLKPTQLPGL